MWALIKGHFDHNESSWLKTEISKPLVIRLNN